LIEGYQSIYTFTNTLLYTIFTDALSLALTASPYVVWGACSDKSLLDLFSPAGGFPDNRVVGILEQT
jgi:hypothetical protein